MRPEALPMARTPPQPISAPSATSPRAFAMAAGPPLAPRQRMSGTSSRCCAPRRALTCFLRVASLARCIWTFPGGPGLAVTPCGPNSGPATPVITWSDETPAFAFGVFLRHLRRPQQITAAHVLATGCIVFVAVVVCVCACVRACACCLMLYVVGPPFCSPVVLALPPSL